MWDLFSRGLKFKEKDNSKPVRILDIATRKTCFGILEAQWTREGSAL